MPGLGNWFDSGIFPFLDLFWEENEEREEDGGQRNENGRAKGEEENEDLAPPSFAAGDEEECAGNGGIRREGNSAAEANRRMKTQSILPNMAEGLLGTEINNERNAGGFDGFWTQWGHQNRNS